MTSDRCSDRIDLYLAVHLWETLFNKIRHRLCIFHACRLGYITFFGIIRPIRCKFFHTIHDRFHYFLLGANFLTRNQFSFKVYVKKRTDIHYPTDKSGSL